MGACGKQNTDGDFVRIPPFAVVIIHSNPEQVVALNTPVNLSSYTIPDLLLADPSAR